MSETSKPTSVHYVAIIHPCPKCGKKAGTTFSRVLCACGMMHTYCASCGVQADSCWDEASSEEAGVSEPTVYVDGEKVRVEYGRPAGSGGMTFARTKRRLPRIRLRYTGRLWEARWIAQNDSWLGQEATTRRAAVFAVIRWARYQDWPLITRVGS